MTISTTPPKPEPGAARQKALHPTDQPDPLRTTKSEPEPYLAPPPTGPVEYSSYIPEHHKPMASPSSEELIRFLTEHKPFLAKQYGVTILGLFGSALHDDLTENSDIDILVDLDFNYELHPRIRTLQLRWYLEDRLHRTVQVIRRDYLSGNSATAIEATSHYV